MFVDGDENQHAVVFAFGADARALVAARETVFDPKYREALVAGAKINRAIPRAAGDVIGNYLLAHVAYYEGEHVMEQIAGKNPKPLDYNRVPRATYSYPQVASLGLSETQAREQGLKVKVGKFPLAGNAKSVILGETEGFVKIISDEESGDLLGVFIIGPSATELISETALAKLLESTPWEIGASIHPHPTVSESLKEAALAVDGVAIHI